MPLPLVLIQDAVPCAAAPGRPRRAARSRESRMFHASAIASASAVVVYALLAAVLPRLEPPGSPIVVELPRQPPIEPLPAPRVERPEPAAPRVDPAQPLEPPAGPEMVASEPAVLVPAADAPLGPAPQAPAAAVANPPGATGAPLAGAGEGEAGSAAQPIAPYYEEAPVPIEEVRPAYPQIAIDARVSGTVLLQVLVGVDGRVENVRVVRSIPLLDGAATDAARRWVFRPARVSGRPVRVWVALPVRFSLH